MSEIRSGNETNLSTERSFGDSCLNAFLQELGDDMTGACMVPVNLPQREIINIVKRAKLHVTGRHHGSIMSFMGRTPFISFQSNMWKTEGDQLLYGPFNSFDFRSITTGDLKKLVVDGLNKYPEWRTKLDIRYSKLQSDFGSQIIKI